MQRKRQRTTEGEDAYLPRKRQRSDEERKLRVVLDPIKVNWLQRELYDIDICAQNASAIVFESMWTSELHYRHELQQNPVAASLYFTEDVQLPILPRILYGQVNIALGRQITQTLRLHLPTYFPGQAELIAEYATGWIVTLQEFCMWFRDAHFLPCRKEEGLLISILTELQPCLADLLPRGNFLCLEVLSDSEFAIERFQ
jgi:hypothetical protein